MNQLSKNFKQLKLTSRRKVFSLLVGNYTSAFKGQGIEFDDLREYVAGDNVKDIDWNATAKSGKIYVRKYIETRELVMLFAIDVSSSMNWGTNENYPKKDIVLNLITLLSLAAERNSDRIGAILFDNEIRDSIAFRKGKTHMLKILKEADAKFENSYFQETDITKTLKFLLDGITKRTICFIFSDFFDLDNSDAKRLLKAANKKHEIIFVNVQDSLDILNNSNSNLFFQDIETGEKQFINLSNANTKDLVSKEFDDYNQKLKNFFARSNVGYISVNQNSDLMLELISFFRNR